MNSSAWGWRHFPGSNLEVARSFPGAPPRERRRVYDQPYQSLTENQHAVARNVLKVENEMDWELAMPRRVEGHSESVALRSQPVSWQGLDTDTQQMVSLELEITQDVWNGCLSPFHDDLWWMGDGISMSQREFATVLRAFQKRSQQPLSPLVLVRFLLGLERVLTPSQGLSIVQTLQSSRGWGASSQRNNQLNENNVHIIVASFLAFPERWEEFGYCQQLVFWNDGNTGCTLSNLSVPRNGNTTITSYAGSLQQRRDWRSCVIPILKDGLDRRLPALPDAIVQNIVEKWVGGFDPKSVAWPQDASRAWSIASLL